MDSQTRIARPKYTATGLRTVHVLSILDPIPYAPPAKVARLPSSQDATLITASRNTLLLTGVTGLLGSYLVRDLLLDGRGLAVVARRDRKRPAAERVEAIVRYWEHVLGRVLPRPMVLEGDLTRADCGLDAASLEWIATHCDEVLHNAASLTFRGTDPACEPWRTNVEGTRHVLDMCRQADIRHFHHVSTAYVCGLRDGIVREDELEVGQDFGNDYERSKVAAERLVRDADHLETVTVFRPSIIVGDSRTGFTSTYHGLFAVLRLGHTLLTRVLIGSTSGPALVALLGVGADDGKNFVPVDWVSDVVSHAVQSPAARGRTYHLTHPNPVPMDTVGRLVQQAVETYSRAAQADDPDLCDERWFADTMREQLDIYRSYLRNDPTFDRTNTLALAGHMPCPDLDMPTLMRMARFAIEHDFGRRPATTVESRPARGTPAVLS
jgi:thioester reductase-like protein